MLTILTVVILLQYMNTLTHCVVHLKLIGYMSIISQFLKLTDFKDNSIDSHSVGMRWAQKSAF